MIQIYRFFLFFLSFFVLVCPLWADQPEIVNEIVSFFSRHGGNKILLQELLTTAKNKKLKSDKYLMVFQVLTPKNNNPTIKNQQLKIVALQARNELCKYIFEQINNLPMQDNEIVYIVYMNEANINKKYRITGIEFISGEYQNKLFAFAVISQKDVDKITQRLHSNEFKQKYCEYIFNLAKEKHIQHDDNDTISLLKELKQMDFFDVEMLIMECEILQQQRKNNELGEAVEKIFAEYFDKLNASLAERLGDIFLELGQEKQAIKCYEASLSSITK